jgi:serine/threonine-protein kinase
VLIAERYRIIERLGSGGMAAVHLAEDETLGRRVALKRLHVGIDPDVTRRFEREARLGASVSHPNVVSVYDVLPEPDGITLVLEYVDGETLSDRLARGRIEPPRALAILRQLGEALDHLHGREIVHRDVKPANVLIRHDGVVKLADLGIATSPDLTRVTQTGAALGTVAYMAPEQVEGGEATAAADVYAFAHPGTSPIQVMRELEEGPPPDLGDAWPAAPPEAVDALKAGMAKDPSERPESARALVERLASGWATEPEPEPPPPPTEPPPTEPPPTQPVAASPRAAPPPRRRFPALAAIAALVLVALGAGAIVLISGGEDPSPRRHTTTTPKPAKRKTAPARPSPAATARSFYENAAAHRYTRAWALAGPGLRAQLGGFDTFRSQFSSVRSLRFERAENTQSTSTGATVAIATTTVHTNRTDHCQGNVFLERRPPAAWRIARIGINCG